MTSSVRTVLLVDDEEFFLRSMVDGFAAHRDRVKVLTAPNGRVALQVVASQPVDLVVTDLKMPELDGFQLVAELSRVAPAVPVITMTAFGTTELEDRLRALGITRWLDKPIDFESLARAVFETLDASASGHLFGISLPTLLQMVELDRKTCTVQISTGAHRGRLSFREGVLYEAEAGAQRGDDAALEVLAWEPGAIDLSPGCTATKRAVTRSLSDLLMDAFRIRDERGRKSPTSEGTVFTPLDDLSEDLTLAVDSPPEASPMSVQEKLKELAAIEGFSGAAVYTPTGEVLAIYQGDVGNLKDVGVLANSVLLNAQKSSLEMGTGRGQQVHVEAERAHILARCLNEGTDPVRSQPGKAHLHVVMVLKNDASIGLAKMRLNSVAEKLAEDFR